MGNITDREINAKPGNRDRWLNETVVWGHGSLCVRITTSGERSFYFRYVGEDKKQDRLPIGSYSRKQQEGYLTLAEARLRARELAALHKSGIKNVRAYLAEKLARRQAEELAERIELDRQNQLHASRKTVEELYEYWRQVAIQQSRRDGGAEVSRIFEAYILPAIGTLPAEDVRKGHVSGVIDPLLARGVPSMAKKTFTLLRQMFRFAVERDLLEIDPTSGIRKASVGGRDAERDRILSAEEINQLDKKLPDSGLLLSTQAAVWICLSTCCRVGELLRARWADIDLERGEWLIPAQHSKNSKPLTVTLSPFAVRQFQQLRFVNSTGEWCFPNRAKNGPVNLKTITKQLTDRQLPPDGTPLQNRSANSSALVLSGGKWTPHDLRRTGATLMIEAGVLPEVVERCLNHQEQNKVKRIYQRYSYAKEMAEAWLILGSRLEIITEKQSRNVVAANFNRAL